MSEFSELVGSLDFSESIKACKEDVSLKVAIHTMQKHHVGCLVVSNRKMEVLGVLSERDVLMKMVNQDVDIETELVKDYMTKHPTCMKVTDTILDVMQAMKFGRFRHMVILNEKGQLHGIISIKDIMDKVLEIIHSKSL